MSATYCQESRRGYGTGDGSAPTVDQLKLGCLQRIADSCEVMASEHNRLLRENVELRQQRDGAWERQYELKRSNSALRGRITRLENQLAAMNVIALPSSTGGGAAASGDGGG